MIRYFCVKLPLGSHSPPPPRSRDKNFVLGRKKIISIRENTKTTSYLILTLEKKISAPEIIILRV